MAEEIRCNDCDRLLAFKVCPYCITDHIVCPECLHQREKRNKAYWDKHPIEKYAAAQAVIDSWGESPLAV